MTTNTSDTALERPEPASGDRADPAPSSRRRTARRPAVNGAVPPDESAAPSDAPGNLAPPTRRSRARTPKPEIAPLEADPGALPAAEPEPAPAPARRRGGRATARAGPTPAEAAASRKAPGVILLPWVRVRGPIKLGRYTLMSTEDVSLPRRLEARFRAFLGRHRGRSGEPIADAAVLAIDGNPLLDVTEDELAEATSWIPVFFTLTNEAVAFRQNMAVAENFDWIFHSLESAEEGLVLETGSVLKERGYLGPSDRVSFQIPPAANAECLAQADPEVAAALNRAIENGDTVTANLVRRSSELLLQAFVNDQRLSFQTRLLLIFFALETLLEADDRKTFRIRIDTWCGTTGEARTPFEVRTRRRNRDMYVRLDLTNKQVWANEFYELRNRITHEPVTQQDMTYRGQPHFWIAFDFFRLALHRRLSASAAAQPFVSLADVEETESGEFVFKRMSFRRKQDVDRGLVGPKSLAHEIEEAEDEGERSRPTPGATAPEVEAARRLLAQGEAIAQRREGEGEEGPIAETGRAGRRRRRRGKRRDGAPGSDYQPSRSEGPRPEPRPEAPRTDEDAQPRNVDHRKTRSMWSELFPMRRGAGGNRW